MLSQSPTQFCFSEYKRPMASKRLVNHERRIMKIVVIGGTGLIGSKLVNKLREHGHEAIAASPNSGVNTLTGEGLAEVLKGASAAVDVSNSPNWEDAAVLNFFETSTRNLLSYEAAAGVKHHGALSVVGTQRLSESGYFRAKIAQEKLIKESSIPYSIVHATQFFEFLKGLADISMVDRKGPVHAGFFSTIAGELGFGQYTGGRTSPTHDETAQLAFTFYESRGRQDGHHIEDWLRQNRNSFGTTRNCESTNTRDASSRY